jgi:hypothetical protein
MLAALLPLALLAQNPKLATPITYTGPTANLPSVMAVVADQAGVKITVQGAPERDYVFLQVKDRPLESLLDLVAKTTQSQWTETAPGEYRIQAPWPPSIDPARAFAIQTWLGENPSLPVLTRARANDLVTAAFNAMAIPEPRLRAEPLAAADRDAPAHQAVLELLGVIGGERLARLPLETTLAYRIRPTGACLPMPPAAKSRFEGLNRELMTLAQVLSQKDVATEGATQSALYRQAAQAELPPADWHVDITAFADSLSVRCRSVATTGEFGYFEEHFEIPVSTDRDTPRSPLLKTNATFAWPPEFRALLATPNDTQNTYHYPPPVIDRLARCAREELFTQGADPALAAFAAGRDLLAIVPDNTFNALSTLKSNTDRAEAVLTRVFPQPVIEEVDGAILLRPADESPYRRLRYPRVEAENVFRESVEIGHASLDTLADMEKACPSSLAFSSLCFHYDRTRTYIGADFPDEKALAVYAALSPGQRRLAWDKGCSMTTSSLPAPLRDALSAFIYDRGSMLRDASTFTQAHRYTTLLAWYEPVVVIGPRELNQLQLTVRVTTDSAFFETDPFRDAYDLNRFDPETAPSEANDFLDGSRYAACPEVKLSVTVGAPQVGQITRTFTLAELPVRLSWTRYRTLAQKYGLPRQP